MLYYLNKSILKILKDNFYAISLYARQIAGTFVLLFIARYLSIYDYGLFSSYKSIAIFCLLIANLGYGDYILVSSNKNVHEVKLKIGLFVLNAYFLLFIIICISSFLSIESNLIFILVLIRTFLDGTFFNLMLPYYQATKRFNLISYINIFYSIVTILIAFFSYYFKLSLIKFLLLSIMLGIFNFFQVTFFAKINYLIALKHFKRLLIKLDKSIFSYCSYNLEWYLFNQTPSLFVAFFIAKNDAAIFFAAYTIANIVTIFVASVAQKLMPELINTSKQNVLEVIRTNIFMLNKINLMVFLVILFAGNLLILLIYKQPIYQKAYYPLLLLSIGNIFMGWATPYGVYITSSGNQNIKSKIQLYTIVVSFSSLLIFYKLGIYAACLAYMISLIFMCILFRQTVNKSVRN